MAETAELKREREVVLQLLAGADPRGNPVLEKVSAWALNRQNHYELIRSPLFIRNLAAGDIFTASPSQPGTFTVVQRSGKLCVRVFSKGDIEAMAEELTPEVEKLGGELDRQAERALVYSLHINIGFAAIERLFDHYVAEFPGSVWFYGNVYDPEDGVSPLNWWTEFIKV